MLDDRDPSCPLRTVPEVWRFNEATCIIWLERFVSFGMTAGGGECGCSGRRIRKMPDGLFLKTINELWIQQ